MKKVLVLCSGNSCRSQMAEGYLSYYASDKIKVISAGLEDHGLNPYAVEVMAEDSIDISHHTSKAIKTLSRRKFDYLITVCDEAKKSIPSRLKIKKKKHFSIPDPAQYVGPEEEKKEEFRKVREQVKKSILKFIGKELLVNNPSLPLA